MLECKCINFFINSHLLNKTSQNYVYLNTELNLNTFAPFSCVCPKYQTTNLIFEISTGGRNEFNGNLILPLIVK